MATGITVTDQLAVGDIDMRVGSIEILSQVSVHLVPGRLLAVVGPNGAGKSTLLSIMAGSLPPSAGHVVWDGRDLFSVPVEVQARRRSVMTQGDDLAFPFLVEEVVMMGRHPHSQGWPDRHDREVVREALVECEVEHLIGRVYTRCSGGERQRIQLARALVQIWDPDPEERCRWLLLDEPTSALDLAHQHACLQVVRQRMAAGVGVLAVLHHLELAATYADDLLVLDQGRVAAHGPVATTLDDGLLSRVYRLPIRCERDADGDWSIRAKPERPAIVTAARS